jgi:hydroxylamine reductase
MKSKKQKITKDLTFYELINEFPGAAEFLMERGLMCGGCPMAQLETIEGGCRAHGLEVKRMIKELNEVLVKDD